ncbi:MAG: T9SS type A sorting domain-containing protein [Bacteroidia bacterium]|nr:T9SS type A sorting domain-containing protein [Bacteroidia bacterium]
MRRLILLVTLFFGSFTIYAQQLLTEDFDYVNGTALNVNSWTQNGGGPGTNIVVDSPGLTYTGYVLSGVGNNARLLSNGRDYYKQLGTSYNSGSIYYSMMVKPDTAKTGDYFFGLFTSTNVSNYFARLYIRSAGTGFYRLGISKGNEAPVYAADSFPLGTVSLVVAKYTFTTGSATNDAVSMYQFTSGFPTTEPGTPSAIASSSGIQDMTNFGIIGLRQGTTASAGALRLDGIRIAQSWSDLNNPTTNRPGRLQFIFAGNITSNSVRLQFTKPSNYKNNLHTVLIFLKKGSSITANDPVRSAAYYQADSNFAGNGTPYEYDTAKCVYNGDGSLVNVTGLQPLTRYIAMGFCISEGDSLYSDSTVSASFVTTSTAPGQAFGFQFTATSTTSIRLNWIRNPNYNVTNHTTVVFLKELSAVNVGSNTMNPYLYFPDTNFAQPSTAYQNDANAKCVFNGDTTFVNVSGLKPGTRYYAYLLGANVLDSVYSNGSSVNGFTLSNGPAAVTQFRFTGRLENNSTVSWTKPAGYNNATHDILVFMRKDTMNLVFGAASQDPNTYTADSVFGGGTGFEYDAQAKCIYRGDANSVNVSNLVINSRYYLVAYAVRTDSGYYSLPNIINNRTMVDTNVSVTTTGTGSTSITVSWVKPANYVNGTHTTIIFLKANSPITAGNPTRSVFRYTANQNFGSGTRYEHDNNAFCVYRGTGTSVIINNLVFGTNYHVLVYSVRQTDSVYSRPNFSVGSPLPPASINYIGPYVKTNTTTGVIDSTGKRSTFRGLVYGANNRTNGVQFVLRDITGGISVLHNTKNFGYTVKEGDSIEVSGICTQTNGLATISTLDTIILLGSNKIIQKPKSYPFPHENTENDLIIFDRVTILSTITNWPTNGTVIAQNNYTGDTVRIRVYSTSGLGGRAVPTGEFSVTGMGSQQSTSFNAPFLFNGYSVVPRRVTDITFNTGDTLANFPLLAPSYFETVEVNVDTARRLQFACGKAKIVRGVGEVRYGILIDNSDKDFTNPLGVYITDNAGLDTTGSVSFGVIGSLVPWLNEGDTVYLKVRMVAQFNTVVKLSTQENLIKVYKTRLTSLAEPTKMIAVNVFPNPASSNIEVETEQDIEKLTLLDMQGKLVLEKSNVTSLNVESLSKGVYILEVQTKNGLGRKRVVIGE